MKFPTNLIECWRFGPTSGFRQRARRAAGGRAHPCRRSCTPDATAHVALLIIVAACCYTDPEGKQRIGDEGRIAKPFTPDRIPPYIAGGLPSHLLADA